MKGAGPILAAGIAIGLQMTLARAFIGSRWSFDLVLVAVVYAALKWGPSSGVIAGTIGGLLQDVLAHTTIGVTGLADSVVGFLVGVVSAQFIVARPMPRVLLVMAATLVQRVAVVGLFAGIDLHWPDVPWLGILGETLLNGAAAFVLFQGEESLPGLLRRRPTRRSNFRQRKW